MWDSESSLTGDSDWVYELSNLGLLGVALKMQRDSFQEACLLV